MKEICVFSLNPRRKEVGLFSNWCVVSLSGHTEWSRGRCFVKDESVARGRMRTLKSNIPYYPPKCSLVQLQNNFGIYIIACPVTELKTLATGMTAWQVALTHVPFLKSGCSVSSLLGGRWWPQLLIWDKNMAFPTERKSGIYFIAKYTNYS